MHSANIITPYKKKGDRCHCNNYRGILLLSIVGKAFAEYYWKGYRHSLNEWSSHSGRYRRSVENRDGPYRSHSSIWPMLSTWSAVAKNRLFPKLKLLRMIESFQYNIHGTIHSNSSSSDPFPIKSGVMQGCVLAPTLFGIFFSLLLSHAFSQSEDGIYLHTSTDGNLFNLARLNGSSIYSNLYLDAELNTWIGKAATAIDHLAKRDWDNSILTISTKMKAY